MERAPREGSGFVGMKILIVDDDIKRAESLGNYLRAELLDDTAELFFSTNVDSAKNSLRFIYFDALILDVVLPKRDREQAFAAHGLQLLDQVHRASFLRKPEKIVGITANLEDIANYRANFEDYCAVVVEARDHSDQWKLKIRNALTYTFSSKIARNESQQGVAVFTIHGIRTYGAWQNRLKRLVETHTDQVDFYSYKYGYFSTFFFLVPALRLLEVNRLQKRIAPILSNVSQKKIYVFCHSFGTWLTVRTLRHLLKSADLETELVLVLSGSVLPSNFDWGFVRRSTKIRVVNECGTKDYVLWMSNALAYGLGMAGKCGFNGFNDGKFVNRYYVGGHSLYFEGDSFMRTNWVPLISGATSVPDVDMRSGNSAVHTAIEGIIRGIGRVKPYLYLTVLALSIYTIWFAAFS